MDMVLKFMSLSIKRALFVERYDENIWLSTKTTIFVDR